MPYLWIIGGVATAALWAAVATRIRRIKSAVKYLDSDEPVVANGRPEPLVSILVPARNEEREIAATLKALAAQEYRNTEIILVDDESTDRTVEVAEAAVGGLPNVRILRGAPRPDGKWIGKSWALTQAAREAKGEWLLFSDADVVHHPAALRLAMQEAGKTGVEAISILPSIDCHSFWDRAIMPLFAVLSALMMPMHKVNTAKQSHSRFSGAFILIRRDTYDAIGRHEAFREDILEDMAMAQRLKEAGRPIRLVYTHDLSRTRMYDRWKDLWQGLTRFGFPMLDYSFRMLALAWVAAFIGLWLAWILVLAGLWFLSPPMHVPGGALLLAEGALLVFLPFVILKDFLRILRIDPIDLFWLPLAALVMCLASVNSAWRHHTGRGLSWKNRTYGQKDEAA